MEEKIHVYRVAYVSELLFMYMASVAVERYEIPKQIFGISLFHFTERKTTVGLREIR